jgi:PadR family transcriptional regulator, regulatory protein PadR
VADRLTKDAVAKAAPLEAARAAAGPGAGATASPRGTGGHDPLVGDLRRGGLLPLLVLHFVGEEPSYGNRLMERVLELTGGVLTVNPNTMYPLLRSLEERGLIAGEWEHPERRSRRYYRLTPDGEIERTRLLGEVGPRLDAVSEGIDRIRAEMLP